jgi:phosphatidylglycerophosphate synthase
MSTPAQGSDSAPVVQRPWDARIARRLVLPLKHSRVTPNHLTTIRLAVGLAAAAAFLPGTYGWSNLAAVLLVLSNFLDHTDGELARISGKSSRIGHLYDLASDAAVTILLFIAIGAGVGDAPQNLLQTPPVALGLIAGCSIALIFFLRMRIEDMAGKSATQQASLGAFETEDVLYLLPLVTLCNGVMPFLMVAAVCSPLFAIWVLIDYRRVLRSAPAPLQAAPSPRATPQAEQAFGARLLNYDAQALRREFSAQGAFLFLRDFLAPEVTAQLVAAVAAVTPSVNRNYLPGHKQGGSVSRHTIDRLAPSIADLYRSPALLHWLEQVSGERLQPSPAEDAHAYALYFYTRPGDHIGWHYDTSYYAGRRYTLLLGVIDESSCRLDYELHTRESGASVIPGSLQIPPGGLVFFDGDKLRHRITPLAAGEMRVSLTFEYVTDPTMHPWRRVISNMKDAVAYFGFRQVFRRRA